MSYGVTERTMTVSHMREVDVPLSYDQAYALCLESLSVIGRYKLTKDDYLKGEIEAESGRSWKASRDLVLFKVLKDDNNATKVTLVCRPALEITTFDYGNS